MKRLDCSHPSSDKKLKLKSRIWSSFRSCQLQNLKMLKHVSTAGKENISYVTLLKACAKRKDLQEGSRLHSDILRKELLHTNHHVASSLVNMYAKCRELEKAKQVVYEIPFRDVVIWNALVGGYGQQGQVIEALECFVQMQNEGLYPNTITFISILKACSMKGDVYRGKQLHDDIVMKELLGKDIALGTALVDMYVKFGDIAKAENVLRDLPLRDVICWTTLVEGHCQQGHVDEAIGCLKQMRADGYSPDAVTFICILKACGKVGAIEKGKKIHDEISKNGLLGKDIVLGTTLIDMYCKCGELVKAQQVLDNLCSRDVISWNALITGYAQKGLVSEALNCFAKMQIEGLSPNAVTYISILKVCGTARLIDEGKQIHEEIAKQGFLRENIILGNALVDMYVSCGELGKAQETLQCLPIRDTASWNALISGYAHEGHLEKVLNCLDQMQRDKLSPNEITFACILKVCSSRGALDIGKKIHEEVANKRLLGKDSVLGTALVDMYAKCGSLKIAEEVLKTLPVRDVITWTALIAGYAQHGSGEEALSCFKQMQNEGISPNAVTFLSIIKACGSLGAVDKGKEIHEEIERKGLLGKDINLGNALVDMYVKFGMLVKAEKVLNELHIRDSVSWTTLISGYAQHDQGREALNCFRQMQNEGISPNNITFICLLNACAQTRDLKRGKQIHEEIVCKGLLGKDVMIGNALVDMYSKCGELMKAEQMLHELSFRDAVSWNALIGGYVEEGQLDAALKCFQQMQGEGIVPDAITYCCILKACGSTGAIDEGKQIHDDIVHRGLLKDVFVGTAVVDMYAKCGALKKAEEVFYELPVRNLVLWNALISGYSQQGLGEEALKCFKNMENDGLSPDASTFITVLNACSHTGLVDEGEMYFQHMSQKYGINPNLDHYTCMVDLFGRAGHFDKAMSMIKRIPSSDHPPVWIALLGACRKWKNVILGRFAFEQAIQIDANNSAVYLLMTSIYAAVGMNEDAAKIEQMRVWHVSSKKPI